MDIARSEIGLSEECGIYLWRWEGIYISADWAGISRKRGYIYIRRERISFSGGQGYNSPK